MLHDKSRKILHLFTHTFPYGKSESILESEISVLAKKFDVIYIQPIFFDDGIIRNSTENIVVLEPTCSRIALNKKKVFINNIYFIVKILTIEFFNCKKKFLFLKKIRSFNVLLINAIFDASIIQKSLAKENGRLFLYSYWMNEWALALSVLKCRNRINSFFFRCGGFDIFDERREGGYLPFRYFVYSQTSAIFTNSIFSVEYISNKNIYPEKIFIQFLGTEDHGIGSFIKEKRFTMVSCSRIVPLKRVHLIVEILKQINFELTWIHFGNGKSVEAVKQLAVELPTNINYELKGDTLNKDIMEFYKNNSVNLFITTSETESLPVSIQEAISFGIPIIATNVGGVSEVVNEQTGYLIDKDFDVEDVASLINGFKNSEKNSMEFRLGVRDFWKRNFEANEVYEKFYHELIKYKN